MRYYEWKKSDMRNELVIKGRKLVEKNPNLRTDVMEAIHICDLEIADGESVHNEYDICMSHFDELKKEST